VIFVRDIKEGSFEWNSNVYVTLEKARRLSAHAVKSGDLLITKMGLPPCLACAYPSGCPTGIVTADVIRLRPHVAGIDSRWLAAALNSDSFKRQVRSITAGVTRPKVTLSDFRKLLLARPSKEEQTRMADRLDSVSQILVNELLRLQNLQAQRLGLMHDLLTGRVPVNG